MNHPAQSQAAYRPKDFRELIAAEEAQLAAAAGASGPAAGGADTVIATAGSAEEPWVAFTQHDRVGLALSGGGIRSATFNLGLLQALRHKKILDKVDYLSTVSGGGYIGGFWTAWRQRTQESDPQTGGALLFPRHTEEDAADGGTGRASPREVRERPEVRHLREFSRFLMPRTGFVDAEMWNGIVAILYGLVPSLFVTLAVIGAALTGWLVVNTLMLHCRQWHAGVMMFLVHLAANFASERRFWKRGGAEPAERRSAAWWLVPVLLSLALGVVMWAVRRLWDFVPGWEPCPPLTKDWVFHPGAINPPWGVAIPAAAWAGLSLILILPRLLMARLGARRSARGAHWGLALDRSIARCLVLAVVWLTFALLWQAAIWLATHSVDEWWARVGLSGGTAGVLAALFAWLRDWLSQPAAAPGERTRFGWLKPVLPQVVAYAAVAALFILVAQGVLMFAFDAHHCEILRLGGAFLLALLIIGVSLALFDPANVGLHEFYRSRIARCYLGAANPDSLKRPAGENRQTNERQEDDLTLGSIPSTWCGDPVQRPLGFAGVRLRPIHLVCCAANHLGGDPLGSLNRGARSAAISQHGVSVAGLTGALPGLRFSSALTASAAAFNSNMGGLSTRLGLPVAFLMTALNLRLGLWVPHPRNPRRGGDWCPGTFFFREMFALTQANDGHHLHLSDGGHFENLGLYELVRRHCRYIIVSDCGADPTGGFDDLGNAIRRVREDFGVEIELELDALRPGPDGWARQHAVAGTVHYDGVTGCDKGTILLFKPVLTGNEPCDVIQYHRSNPVFPQEPTSDQFYDEAQWESYHRLGEHSAHESFRFVETLPAAKQRSAETLFHFARQRLQPGWQEQDEQFLAITARCSELESEIRDHAPAFLRAEFFPEAAAAAATVPSPSVEEELTAVYFLMQAAQVMEDAWLACRLEMQWAHPLNQGWMSYLHRWTSTPSFRRWWPVLRPIYGAGFGDFVKQRFEIAISENCIEADAAFVASPEATLRVSEQPLDQVRRGLAWAQWERQRRGEAPPDGAVFVVMELQLATAGGLPPRDPLQVGVAVVHFEVGSAGDRVARWNSSDFYVPPALEGAGFVGRFLTELVKLLEGRHAVKEMRVSILDARPTAQDPHPRPRPDPASRARRLQLLEFYRSRGFLYDVSASNAAGGFNQLVRRAT